MRYSVPKSQPTVIQRPGFQFIFKFSKMITIHGIQFTSVKCSEFKFTSGRQMIIQPNFNLPNDNSAFLISIYFWPPDDNSAFRISIYFWPPDDNSAFRISIYFWPPDDNSAFLISIYFWPPDDNSAFLISI